MPRQPRIDIPGLLQHVMVRGIERSDIFLDDDDRRNFLRRLSALLIKTGTDCFAWALLPNHCHLLLRCSSYDLTRFMRSLLTGYAVGLGRLRQEVSDYFGIPAELLSQRGRQNKNSRARELFCYLATRELGYSGAETGSVLRMGNSSVTRAARRGEALFTGEGEIRRWWLDLLKP